MGVPTVIDRKVVPTILCLCSLLLGSGLAGCGGAPAPAKGSVRKAPVSGTVTLEGKPLAGAEVYFYTEKFTGFGKTNAEGKFQLAQGAAIGTNKVFISKLEGEPGIGASADPTLALNDPGQVAISVQSGVSGTGAPGETIPAEYNSQATTRLTFEVPEAGAKDANFSL